MMRDVVIDKFMTALDLIMSVYETEETFFGRDVAYSNFLKRNTAYSDKYEMIETMRGEVDLARNITLLALNVATLMLCFQEMPHDAK